MTSTAPGYNYNSTLKKFYSNSIKSESTDMTEEDEDFHHFSNSSSFQTSTTNSSPVNIKLDAEDQLLYLQGFYSGASLSHKNHSSFVRRSIILSPSMRNFNNELLTGSVAMKAETPTFGLTSSPSMKALESILNEKTKLAPLIDTIDEEPSETNVQTNVQTHGQTNSHAQTLGQTQIIPPSQPYSHNNMSISSFHTANSGTSETDFAERQNLLASETTTGNHVHNSNDNTELHGLPSPGMEPITKLGIFSPVTLPGFAHGTANGDLNRRGTEPQRRSMLLDDPEFENGALAGGNKQDLLQKPPIEYSRRSPRLDRGEFERPDDVKKLEKLQRVETQLPRAKKPLQRVDETKKNRRKSFVGFLKNRKSASSANLVEDVGVADRAGGRPELQTGSKAKSTSDIPIYQKGKSKSMSNLELVSNGEDESRKQDQIQNQSQNQSQSRQNRQNQIPNQGQSHNQTRPKSIFSAFKRKSAYAAVSEPKAKPKPRQETKSKSNIVSLQEIQQHDDAVDRRIIKESELANSKRNSILVPSPTMDQAQFEAQSEVHQLASAAPIKAGLFKDLSFSASMVSSINHNYDIVEHSMIDEAQEAIGNDSDSDDEFNSSFNTIKKSYSGDLSPPKILLPRDVSVGSLRLDFDNFNIDNYSVSPLKPQAVHDPSSDFVTAADSPARKLQHHKSSSKIQNLLGEALFPKSLDINEVTSITTLERSRSLKSIKSSTGGNNSFRDSLMADGMTVVSMSSPKHEPNQLLSSPSSILKRRSFEYGDSGNSLGLGEEYNNEYDDELEQFAKMINFGDDDDEDLENLGLDMGSDSGSISKTGSNFRLDPSYAATSSPVAANAKPLPSLPSRETLEDDTQIKNEESVDFLPGSPLDEEQNPFGESFGVKREDESVRVKQEEFDFEFGLKDWEVKQKDAILEQVGGYDEYEEDEQDYEHEYEHEHEYDHEYDHEYEHDNDYDYDDTYSVKIKKEPDFDEDFNSYEYAEKPSPTINAYIPPTEDSDTGRRPISMSLRGLNGPKFGETNKLVQSNSTSHSLYMTLPEESASQQYLQTSPSRLNLNEKILRNYYNNGASKKVSFSSRILLFDTYHEEEYDRHPEIATCNQLTPLLAQQIKEELNLIKSQMPVHESSKCYTQFF